MDENGDLVDLRQCSRLLSHRVLEISVLKCVCGAGVESSSGNMDENGDLVDIRQRSDSFPIALMALPVKPQSTWTLEPEHAQNIRGGQVRI